MCSTSLQLKKNSIVQVRAGKLSIYHRSSVNLLDSTYSYIALCSTRKERLIAESDGVRQITKLRTYGASD